MHRVVLTVTICLYLAVPSFAWNALGHRVVAEIAWQQLTPERRQEIVDTLKRHPRFGKDFIQQMPRDVASADQATHNRWIFWQAGVWPDVARGIPGDERKLYDRGTWHYVNVRTYLDAADREALDGKLTNNMSSEFPTDMPENEWNIIQATYQAQSLLRDKSIPAAERAIAYCWLFHLAGDSHQPLHSCALFSANRFPTGDRGGNDIPLPRGGNLHSLWDNLLGRQQGVNDVRRRAAELDDRELYGDVWDSAAKKTDIRQWLAESFSLAKSFAYSDTIRTTVRHATPQQPIERIELSEAYLKSAGHHARERVLAAGLRLAAILETIDGDKQTNAAVLSPNSPVASPFAPPASSPQSANQLGHWLNSGTGVRHNSSCKWYGKTKRGRYCTSSEGKACGQCGG